MKQKITQKEIETDRQKLKKRFAELQALSDAVPELARAGRCRSDIGNLGRTGTGIGYRPGPNAY